MIHPIPFGEEARWTQEPVWILWSTEKYIPLTKNRSLIVQPAASSYTDRAISTDGGNCIQHKSSTCCLMGFEIAKFCYLYQLFRLSRDGVVGTAVGYGLEDRGVGVRVPVLSKKFSSPRLPPNILPNGYREFFPWGKEAGEWSWPLTFN
jgi:hypothetical protein